MATAIAVAQGVRTLYCVADKPKPVPGHPLFSESWLVRSLVLAAVFGQKKHGNKLHILDPRTGEEVVLPSD